MSKSFLFYLHGLVQVVRELQHSMSGVSVITEDGCVYEADYVIVSVSIGVLQSHLIAFNPPLPVSLNQPPFLLLISISLPSPGVAPIYIIYSYNFLLYVLFTVYKCHHSMNMIEVPRIP